MGQFKADDREQHRRQRARQSAIPSQCGSRNGYNHQQQIFRPYRSTNCKRSECSVRRCLSDDQALNRRLASVGRPLSRMQAPNRAQGLSKAAPSKGLSKPALSKVPVLSRAAPSKVQALRKVQALNKAQALSKVRALSRPAPSSPIQTLRIMVNGRSLAPKTYSALRPHPIQASSLLAGWKYRLAWPLS